MAKPGKNKQCIAIARDVISQINTGKYIPISGNYLNSTGKKGEDNPFVVGDLQKQLKRREKPCGVCAIGSMFLSRVRIYDKYKIAAYSDCMTGLPENPTSIYSGEMRASLITYFSYDDLAWIEAVYESLAHFVVGGGLTPSVKDFKKSPIGRLKRLIRNKGERMKWIMRHIIRNNGNFNAKNATKAAAKLANP